MRYQRDMPGIAVSVSVDGPDSGAEQLRLGGGEFVVSQDALLVQRRQLVELVEHGRRLGRSRWRGRRRRLGRRLGGLLLFQIADALVLLRLLLVLLSWRRATCFPAMYAPPPTTAARSSGRLLLNIIASLLGRGLHVIGEGKAESYHELRRGRDDPGPADLRGDGDQHADDVLRRGPGVQRVGHLPDVRGRRGVERDERGQLDQGVAARVQTAPRLPFGPQFQARGQKVVVAPG